MQLPLEYAVWTQIRWHDIQFGVKFATHLTSAETKKKKKTSAQQQTMKSTR